MEALQELRHEGLSLITVKDIGGFESKVQAVEKGRGKCFSVTVMEWDEINPLREGVDDGKTFIVAGNSFALALIVNRVAGSGAVVGACCEHAMSLTSARFFQFTEFTIFQVPTDVCLHRGPCVMPGQGLVRFGMREVVQLCVVLPCEGFTQLRRDHDEGREIVGGENE